MSLIDQYNSDFFKFVKNNPEKILEGKTLEANCPYCNQLEKIYILENSRAKCLKCNNEFNISFKMHID